MSQQSTQPDLQQRVHFHNLDVLRFLAAFMIVIMHGYNAVIGWQGLPRPIQKYPGERFPNTENMNDLGLWIRAIVNNLDFGVEFFFLISGFLITYLIITEINKTGKLHIPRFYFRRALRIWPLYFLVLAVIPYLATITEDTEPNYWWNILFVNNYHSILQRDFEPMIAHYWSISIEEHFYLFWPLLLAFIPFKKMPQLFVTIIFVSIASRVYFYNTSPDWYYHIRLNTLCRMDTLALGGLLAWVVFNAKSFEFRVPGWIRIMIYLTFIFVIAAEPAHDVTSVLGAAFKRYAYTVFLAFILMNYLFNPDAWFNFKKKNILHYLGKISFGIYLWHNILFTFIMKKIVWTYELDGFITFWIIYLSITLALAILSYELIEKHFLKLKNRFAIIHTYR